MKKPFEEPLVEISEFSVEDIITASSDDNPDWSGEIGGGVQ